VIGQYELASEATFTPLKMVLVVEDDVDFGTNLVQVIREETVYHAMHVTDAFEALRVIGHLKCDLFLLDYQLPGIDGIDLYDLLCSTPGYEEVSAIIISASARVPQREMEKRNLVRLNKPFELDVLLHTMQELLEPAVSH